MNELHQQDSGWRGSRELWLEAAYELLLEGGIENVRILSLAKRLKIARTSFYWFFKDRDDLLNALLSMWQNKNTTALIKQVEAYADTLAEATLNIFDCWLDPLVFDSCFEHAVRSWGIQAAIVSQALEQADTQRLEALKAMYMRHGSDPLVADVRSRALYLTQIGYISLNTNEQLATRMERVPSYVAIFSGVLPSDDEMARFHSRHNFTQAY